MEPRYQAQKDLRQELSNHLNWNKTRLDFLANFLLALITVRTINLAEIAMAFYGKAKVASHYKRLQRFFRGFEIESEVIARLIGSLLPTPKPWVLTIDRTNWQFGKVQINILMLGVVCQGVAWPLFWIMLNKKGNSDTEERIELIERFLKVFGHGSILFITADREFIGETWIKWLKDEKISFRIRIKKNTLLKRGNKTTAVWKTFQNGRPTHTKGIVWGLEMYLAGCQLQGGEFIIVISDTPGDILKDYALRWKIETLFGCLKSRGFRLEETHLTHMDRLNKLIALLAIAFAWIHRTGEYLIKSGNKIPLKKHCKDPSNRSSGTGLTACGM